MSDINKELQKLKAMINQRQTTAIFSNKSNESTKLAHGDTELYINDMTRKFSFTRAGVINPIMIDARNKTLENVEYLNGTKVEDITSSTQSINKLRERVDEHDEILEIIDNKDKEQDERITTCETNLSNTQVEINSIKTKDIEQDQRISHLEESGISIDVVEELIDDKVVYDPLSVNINWSVRTDEDGFKYIDFTFNPSITEANLQPGTHYFANVDFDTGSSYSVGWTKILNENRQWKVTYIGGRLNNNTWEYIFPTTRYNLKSISTHNDVFCKNLVAKYELSDNRLKNAIVESTRAVVQDESGNINIKNNNNSELYTSNNHLIWFNRQLIENEYIRFDIGKNFADTAASFRFLYTYPGKMNFVFNGGNEMMSMNNSNRTVTIPAALVVDLGIHAKSGLTVHNGSTLYGQTVVQGMFIVQDKVVIESMTLFNGDIYLQKRRLRIYSADDTTSSQKRYLELYNTGNGILACSCYEPNGNHVRGGVLFNGSQTVTHVTNSVGELGTFCEATGDIYDGYDKITNTDCICAVKQSNGLNKKIVGIITDSDQFASHGDVLVRVNDISGLEIGDILCPDDNGYGRKADDSELIFMMLNTVLRPKITSFNTNIEGYVACFLV